MFSWHRFMGFLQWNRNVCVLMAFLHKNGKKDQPKWRYHIETPFLLAMCRELGGTGREPGVSGLRLAGAKLLPSASSEHTALAD